MNEERMRQIARLGDRHPKNFDISRLLGHDDKCGTVGCFVGWEHVLHYFDFPKRAPFSRLNSLTDSELDKIYEGLSEGDSEHRLGLPNDRLFYCDQWPERIQNGYDDKKMSWLQIVNDYISTNGWENE